MDCHNFITLSSWIKETEIHAHSMTEGKYN